jgi:leader peptidase (prepilin peptidase)/N-methyltransferase
MLDIVALLPLAYLAVIAIPLIIVDVREHRLPNKMVLPFIALSFITTIVVSLVDGQWISLLITLGTAVAILFLGVYLNGLEWLGMGDVKLFVGITLALGYFSVLYSLAVIALALVLAYGLTMATAVRRVRATLRGSITLGPYAIVLTLVGGAVAVLA